MGVAEEAQMPPAPLPQRLDCQSLALTTVGSVLTHADPGWWGIARFLSGDGFGGLGYWSGGWWAGSALKGKCCEDVI